MNVFIVSSYSDYCKSSENLGIFDDFDKAYQELLPFLRGGPEWRSSVSAYYIEEWEVNGNSVNIHRYDN